MRTTYSIPYKDVLQLHGERLMNPKKLVAALLLMIIIVGPTRAVTYRTVALSGQRAPGTGPDVNFNGFGFPVINDVGNVAFPATLIGTGVIPGSASGLWTESASGLRIIVRAGDHAIGLGTGVNYGSFSNVVINHDVQAAFLVPVSNFSTAVYSEGQGALRLVAHQGDQPPGFSLSKFSLISPLSMNKGGQTAFIGLVSGGSYNLDPGIWSDRSGPLQLIIRSGDTAPGIPGQRIRALSGGLLNDAVSLNDLGQLVFTAQTFDLFLPSAIYSEQSGVFTLLVRSGQVPLPDAPGVTFSLLRNAKANISGQIMFYGDLTGTGVDSSNNSGLWTKTGDSFHLVAREGSPAAGTSLGINNGMFFDSRFNGIGEVTFTGSLLGAGIVDTNNTALWTEHNGTQVLIAREGDSAPGLASNIRFGDFSNASGAIGLQVNKSGQVAFESILTGPGVTDSNDRSIWATDRAGNLRLVAREGDLFDVNDDPAVEDVRTISRTSLNRFGGNGEDGNGTSFNDAGKLVIALDFTDTTSGVFVIDMSVPEPSAIILLAAGFSTTLLRCGLRARNWHMLN